MILNRDIYAFSLVIDGNDNQTVLQYPKGGNMEMHKVHKALYSLGKIHKHIYIFFLAKTQESCASLY